jgi:hypothetical protein
VCITARSGFLQHAVYAEFQSVHTERAISKRHVQAKKGSVPQVINTTKTWGILASHLIYFLSRSDNRAIQTPLNKECGRTQSCHDKIA